MILVDEFKIIMNQIPTATLQESRSTYNPKLKRIQVYEPTSVKKAKRDYYFALMPHAPTKPIPGAKKVEICFCFGTKNKKLKGKLKTSRPDVDNMAKILLDRMTKLGYWKDDSEVSRLDVMKRYVSEGESPNVKISIWRMEND